MITNKSASPIENTTSTTSPANIALAAAIAKAGQNKVNITGAIAPKQIVPKVPEGVYLGVIVNAALELNQPSKYGINDKVKLDLSLCTADSADSLEMPVSYWKSSSVNSLYYKHISSLLDRDVRNGFSLDELVGITCQVEIVHNRVEHGAYANIKAITPITIEVPNFTII